MLSTLSFKARKLIFKLSLSSFGQGLLILEFSIQEFNSLLLKGYIFTEIHVFTL